jgi:hypothetical protein
MVSGPGQISANQADVLTPLPSGGYQAAGVLSDPRGVLAPISLGGLLQPYDRVDRKRLMALCGSSTVERCFQANRPSGIATIPMVHANNGFMGIVQMLNGSPFAYAKGGCLGKGGVVTGPASTTDTVCWQVDQALALSPKVTDILISPMGNDDLSTVSVDQIWEWTLGSIQKCLKAGARVWLYWIHMKAANNAYKSMYLDFQARSTAFAALYPGRVITVDGFSGVLNPATGFTSTAYLDATLTHLNVQGCRVAAQGWSYPLYKAGLSSLSVDPETFGTLLTSNPRFTGSTGAYSGTGWTGSSGFSTIAEGPDRDPFGRRTTRVTQVTAGTVASLRQTYTPSGAAGNIGRIVFMARPVQNVRTLACTLQDGSATWSITDLNVNRDGDTSYDWMENGRWYSYVSPEFEIPASYFAANSRLNIQCNQGASDPLAIMDVSCAALVKTADAWPA